MHGATTPPWGWHRLRDGWARELVSAAGIEPGDLVLDIGAGTGAITAPLLAAGARVVAIELHERRTRVLRERFAHAQVTVVRTDASDLRLPRRPFRVVANPPFGSTTAILRRLLGRESALLTADLVVPTQVAARWAGGRGAGTRRWQRRFAMAVGYRIPRRAFVPNAPIQATVLCIRRRAT